MSDCRGKAAFDSIMNKNPFWGMIPDSMKTSQPKAKDTNSTQTSSKGKQQADSYGAFTTYDENGSITKINCTHF